MGTHPIFESDFDCLTDCQALRLAFEMAKKESEEVTKLSNKELKEKLTSLGITTGPIVDSTRKIYERKLEKLLTKGKDLAYSTDEDAVPEQEVESEDKPAEPVKEKKVTRTKKVPKSDPVVEEKFSDEEEEEPVVKNSSSRRRSARILKSKPKKETEVEEIQEQEEEVQEEPEVEPESVEEQNEEIEVAKDESKSTESVQVLSPKTAIPSHIHTILFLALVTIAGYLLYSEADAIQSALEDMWDYAVASYTRLYYSMMPEIETIQPDTPPPPA